MLLQCTELTVAVPGRRSSRRIWRPTWTAHQIPMSPTRPTHRRQTQGACEPGGCLCMEPCACAYAHARIRMPAFMWHVLGAKRPSIPNWRIITQARGWRAARGVKPQASYLPIKKAVGLPCCRAPHRGCAGGGGVKNCCTCVPRTPLPLSSCRARTFLMSDSNFGDIGIGSLLVDSEAAVPVDGQPALAQSSMAHHANPSGTLPAGAVPTPGLKTNEELATYLQQQVPLPVQNDLCVTVCGPRCLRMAPSIPICLSTTSIVSTQATAKA